VLERNATKDVSVSKASKDVAERIAC
jgi:hypothetical protein